MWWLLFLFACGYVNGLQVNTTEGMIVGTKAADGNYYAFYGIPYAGPTDGNNRFKAPVPPSPYPGLFHAMNNNVICAQPSTRGLIGVENCLTLSVFTNNVNTLKPVIVFLNAEEYTTSNTQMFSYKTFVEEDVVFVPMNFRLSIFGFLCLGVAEAPGNAGLKDVIQGLNWIQANIVNFGGNPRNVTLLGHGSGAAIVDLLTLTNKVDNLVHKAIALSGSALAPWAVAYDHIRYARSLGALVGYSGRNNVNLAKHLVKTNVTVLNTALNRFKFHNNTPLFAPCIENTKLISNNTILSRAPISILKSGNYSQIPFIYGYVTREGTLRAEEAAVGNWLATMNTNFANFLQVDLNFGTHISNVSSTIRNFYFSGKAITMETIQDYLDYFGDTLVMVGVIRAAKERAFTSRSEVRLLDFGYVGTMNSDWTFPQIPLTGARHGSFLNYLFDFDLRNVDQGAREAIVKRFIAFARTGAQNLENSTTWLPISNRTTHFIMYRGEDGPIPDMTATFVESTMADPYSQTINFWEALYDRYYVAPSFSSSSVTVSCVFALMLTQLIVMFI